MPIQDTVQEFQQLQLNMSAQYGNSAGAINNLVTKSGTNAWHGSALGVPPQRRARRQRVLPEPTGNRSRNGGGFKPPLRFNQFGGTVGGPIIKDKLVLLPVLPGRPLQDHRDTPQSINMESPEWRAAVDADAANAELDGGAAVQEFHADLGAEARIQFLWTSISVTPMEPTRDLLQPLGFGYADYLCPDFAGDASIAAKLAAYLGCDRQQTRRQWTARQRLPRAASRDCRPGP